MPYTYKFMPIYDLKRAKFLGVQPGVQLLHFVEHAWRPTFGRDLEEVVPERVASDQWRPTGLVEASE